MQLASSPLWQNLLLEDPWPAALALIIVAAVLAFLAFQRADKRLLRFAGIAAALAVAIFLVANLVTTTHERIILNTEELVGYTAPLQLDAFKAMADPRITLTVEEGGGPRTISGDTVFEKLERTVQGQPIEGQTIITIDADVRGPDDAVSSFDVRTDVRGGRFMTRWVLTWKRQPDDTWRVTAVDWIDCPHLIGVKPSMSWLR